MNSVTRAQMLQPCITLIKWVPRLEFNARKQVACFTHDERDDANFILVTVYCKFEKAQHALLYRRVPWLESPTGDSSCSSSKVVYWVPRLERQTRENTLRIPRTASVITSILRLPRCVTRSSRRRSFVSNIMLKGNKLKKKNTSTHFKVILRAIKKRQRVS